MKKIIFAMFLFAVSIKSFSQCDKNIKLTSSKTEYLDSSMSLQRSVDENSIVEITKSTISISPGGGHKKTGNINSNNCGWTTPFKEGKSVIKATLSDPGRGNKNVTITIEGKDGKIVLLFEMDDTPAQKIRVPIDTFEESK